MKTILLFGASGLCGSAIGRLLVQEDVHLRAFLRPGRRSADLDFNPNSIFFGSLLNQNDLRSAMNGVDTVAYFVSTSIPATSNNDPSLEFTESLPLLNNILLAATQAGVKRVVFPSSGGTVYGPADGATLESAPLRPTSGYGMGKVMAEELLQFYERTHKLKCDILRVSNVYGYAHRRASPQGIIDIFLDNAILGQVSEVWGSLENRRDYVFSGDLAEAVRVLIREDDSRSGIYNLGSGRSTSIGEILEIIGEVTQGAHRYETVSSQYAGITSSHLDCEKIFSEIGWRANCDLAEGIAKTWEMKKQSQILP